MTFEDIQFLKNETIDNSIIKRVSLKNYSQQETNLNDSDQKIEFMFRENKNYHQIGNAYL